MKKEKIILFISILGIILFSKFFIVLRQLNAKNIFLDHPIKPTNTSWLPNPEDFPPQKATIWVGIQETQQAGALLPPPNLQDDYLPATSLTVEDALSQKLVGTLSGFGIITEVDPPVEIKMIDGKKKSIYDLQRLNWYEETYDSFINIWSGVSTINVGTGIIYVSIMPHYFQYQEVIILENPGTGDLKIIGSKKERIILKAANEKTIYFDVPSLSFVTSLEEVASSATPVSTNTPSPLNSRSDDSPDKPGLVNESSSTGKNLNYFIDYPNDYDWFKFYSVVQGDISISLTKAPGNCGIRLVRLGTYENGDWGEILQDELTPKNEKVEIFLPNAKPSDYEVRVWCPDGSFSSTKPYTLRIDIPKPEKVIPILECVSENSDGTFIAHFGYNNPNQFVVNVNADNDNSFQPAPVFRTGQPELFAPGRIVDFFSVLFDGNGLTWTLDGGAVTANRNSARCP